MGSSTVWLPVYTRPPMPGAIGVTCAETGRYSMFSACLARLRRPPGTHIYFVTGSDREQGRNELVREMLANGDQWLLFLDDDQTFEEDLLERLLAHEVDVVGALYLRRDMPYTPICYDVQSSGEYTPIDLRQYGKDELIRVDIVGTGGMLVRRYVFESMKDPWFKRGKLTEDMIWCNEVRGEFDIYCDLAVRMGHMTIATISPGDGPNDEWAISFNISGQMNFITPVS